MDNMVSPKDLLENVALAENCSNAVLVTKEICIAIDKDSSLKYDFFRGGLVETLAEWYFKSRVFQSKSFLLLTIKWLCQGDLDAKIQVHAHGGVKFLLSALQDQGDGLDCFKDDKLALLHGFAFQALAELSQSSPLLQAEFWSLGLLNSCLSVLKMGTGDTDGNHKQCCLLDVGLKGSTKITMENMILGKNLFGKFCRIRDISTTGIQFPKSLNIDCYEVMLFQKVDGKDVPIFDSLLKSQSVWAKDGYNSLLLGFSAGDSDDEEQVEKPPIEKGNILVTKLVSCNLLAGYRNSNTVDGNIKDISAKLENEARMALPVNNSSLVSKEDFVFFPFIADDQMQWKRGYLLDKMEETARVFCIDYGTIESVSFDMMYKLPQRFLEIPPQICFCILKGIHPLPRGKSSIIYASRIFRTFCTGGHYLKVDILSNNCVEAVIRLCRLPWIEVLVNAIGSLEALATNLTLKERIGSLGIFPILRDILLFKLQSESLIEVTLGCLINLFVENSTNRSRASSFNILPVTIFALQRLGNPMLKALCTKAIKNLVGNQWNLLHPTDLRSVQEMSTRGHHSVKLDLSKTVMRQQRSKSELKSQPVYKALSVDDIVNALVMEEDSSSSISSEEDVTPAFPPSAMMDSAMSNASSNHQVDEPKSSKEGYTYQDFLPLIAGQCYEFRPEVHLKMASRESMGQSICAILNTGRHGSIVFGVEENSRIFGINVGRDQRDLFRLGLDSILQRMSPSANQSRIEVKFIPVMERPRKRYFDLFKPSLGTKMNISSNKSQIMQQFEERFVVIIDIKDSNGVLFKWSGNYFVREGKCDATLSIAKLRRRLIDDVGAKYKDEIKRLQALIAEKERMHTLGTTSSFNDLT